MTGALKLQNQELAESCEKTLIGLLGYENAKDIVIAAILQLSETDASSFAWVSQNFSHSAAWLDLRETALMLTVDKLLRYGLILGEDFSISQGMSILVTAPLKADLIDTASQAERLFLDVLLNVFPT